MNPIFTQIDELIRSGQSIAAASLLLEQTASKPSRAEALQLAGFARRLGRPELGLRLLHAYVRNDTIDGPTIEEKIEYAGNLVRLGLSGEAKALLKSTDLAAHPQGLLFAAFALNYEWQNKQACGYFQQYCSAPQLTEYQRAIGQLNLSESLLRLREFDQADRLLDQMQTHFHTMNYQLLLAVVFELQARSLMFRKKFELASDLNANSLAIHQDSDSLDALSARAQSCILGIASAKGKMSPAAAGTFRQIESEARRRRRYELIRDMYFWISFLQPRNPVAWNRLYLGTRHEGYRTWMMNQQPDRHPPQPAEGLAFPAGPLLENLDNVGKMEAVPDPRFTIEPNEGRFLLSKTKQLKKSQAMHRLVKFLVSDIFRPPTVPEIHAVVFPGDHFHPLSGPNRVHQLLIRTRTWLEQNAVPLLIQEEGSVYYLASKQSLRIVATSTSYKSTSDRKLYEDLVRLKAKDFSISEVEIKMKLPRRQIQRRLKSLCESGHLKSTGAGRSQRYTVEQV